MKHRVLLVDDHPLFRKVLRTLINTFDQFEVMDEASSGSEFLESLNHAQPDLVMLDIAMPGMDGIEAATRALEKFPDLKIITISMYGDPGRSAKAMAAGIRAFLRKTAGLTEIKAVMETVMAGGHSFPQGLAATG